MDYESLRYLPKINGVTVIGDRTIEDFGMVEMSSSDVDEIMLEVFGCTL